MTVEKQRDDILLAVLPHVLFDGWSWRALEAGLKDVNLSPTECRLIFPGGVLELAAHFSNYADRQMLRQLNSMDLALLSVRDRIITATRARLEVVAPYREPVRRLLAFLSMPQNNPTGLRCSFNTVDAIWYAAGDTATDFSYYSKRGLLLGIYSATVLYWLADESEEFCETWSFLERRIDDVQSIPKLGGKVIGRLKNGLGIMPRQGRRIFRPI